MNVCIQYDGVGVPDRIEFELKIKFDALKNDSSRMYFLHAEKSREETRKEQAYKGIPKCERFFGYLVVSLLHQ